jgi:hypothetical protein
MTKNNDPAILKQEEARKVLQSVEDPITSQLMNMANFEVLTRFLERKDLPGSDFDLCFFMEVMKGFCSQHKTIAKILAGEDLRLWTDEDLPGKLTSQA